MEDKIIEIIEELGRIPLVISHETLTEYLTEDEIDDLSVEDLIFVEIDEKTISCTVKENANSELYLALKEED
ncbi:hypothetical protein SAMN02745174_02555 [Cetobacterium ceti]|uniref:Uncharacterized protein n=1 Tax=Cetobacterium ceti TaxID=180163 RepID=A0A1T4R2D4_9FUSO|nr:hypothetical protein [Cetobacterium ceti]SKA10046.1 hypothetical protein SAMN02745174_02555 [Cetobacterium ceti]